MGAGWNVVGGPKTEGLSPSAGRRFADYRLPDRQGHRFGVDISSDGFDRCGVNQGTTKLSLLLASFRHVTALAILSTMLFGCQTPEARLASEADKIANAFGDFIAFRNRLPIDTAALRTFADSGGYGVRWQRFSDVSFRPISAAGVRVEFVDRTGQADYRIIIISARGLAPFEPFSASSATNNIFLLLHDPKTRMMLYH